MATSAGEFLETGDFALAACRTCGREVLAYPDVEGEAWRCVHCDMKVGGELRWIDAAGLEAIGYAVDSAEVGKCTSCAAGGCAIPRKEG